MLGFCRRILRMSRHYRAAHKHMTLGNWPWGRGKCQLRMATMNRHSRNKDIQAHERKGLLSSFARGGAGGGGGGKGYSPIKTLNTELEPYRLCWVTPYCMVTMHPLSLTHPWQRQCWHRLSQGIINGAKWHFRWVTESCKYLREFAKNFLL